MIFQMHPSVKLDREAVSVAQTFQPFKPSAYLLCTDIAWTTAVKTVVHTLNAHQRLHRHLLHHVQI